MKARHRLTLQYPSPVLSNTFFAILLSELKLFFSPNPVLTFLFCTLLFGEDAFSDGDKLEDVCEAEATSDVAAVPRRDTKNGTTNDVYLISGICEGGEAGVVLSTIRLWLYGYIDG
jgi:hypothetical protein